MKKNLLLISLFVVSISYGQIKTLKSKRFSHVSQCTSWRCHYHLAIRMEAHIVPANAY